jgi:hypothetical protein
MQTYENGTSIYKKNFTFYFDSSLLFADAHLSLLDLPLEQML